MMNPNVPLPSRASGALQTYAGPCSIQRSLFMSDDRGHFHYAEAGLAPFRQGFTVRRAARTDVHGCNAVAADVQSAPFKYFVLPWFGFAAFRMRCLTIIFGAPKPLH